MAPATLLAIGLIGLAPSAQAGSAQLPPPPPVATPILVSATNTANSVTLTWRQPTTGNRPRSFRVYEGDTVVARNTTTHVTVPDLGFGTTHTFRVTAVDANGVESFPSLPITQQVSIPGANPGCLPPPDRLQAVDVQASAVGLSWAGGVGPPGVILPRTVRVSGAGQAFLTDLSHARIGGLAPATSYVFEVVRPNCPGQPAATITVTTLAGPPARPGAPTGLTVRERTPTSIGLSWAAPAGAPPATRYGVFEGAFLVGATDATSIVLPGLWRETAHRFTVAAFAGGDESQHSPAVATSTLPCDQRPPAPVRLTATAVSASSVELSWVSETAPAGFTVYEGSTPLATTRLPSARITGLASASRHNLTVVTQLPGECGTTPASAVVRVTTKAGPRSRPLAPTDLRQVFDRPTPGQITPVTLAWTQPNGGQRARSYRIYEGARLLGTSTTTTITIRLPAATHHLVSVVAVNAAGNESRPSAPINAVAPFVPPP